MLAGNAAETDDNKVNRGNICHRCWTSTNEDNFVGGAPCTGSDTVAIPQDTRCKMIRQTIIFPQYGLNCLQLVLIGLLTRIQLLGWPKS
jgi:hypothetical protein